MATKVATSHILAILFVSRSSCQDASDLLISLESKFQFSKHLTEQSRMSSGSNFISNLLSNLPWLLPNALVFVGGLVFAIKFMGRCPTASLLTILALSLLVFETLLAAGVRAYLISALPPERIHTWFLLISLIQSILHAVSLCLLVTAVFVERKSPSDGTTAPNPPRP